MTVDGGMTIEKIMTVAEIYKKYNIPPNLIEHQLTVAKVICVLQKHWLGVEINWQEMILIGLMHDIGNIVKFDFDKYPEFLGQEKKNLVFWKEEQKRIIKKYGKDDHLAVKKILKELNLNLHIDEVIQKKSFKNSVLIAQSDDWYTKILAYADLRVLPGGIGTLDERIEDVRKRIPKYSTRKDFPELINAARKLESQIQIVVGLPISKILEEVKTISSIELLKLDY